jgi:hypothetical protein
MCHLDKWLKLDLLYIILKHMIDAAESETRKVTLPYEMILTMIFFIYKSDFKKEKMVDSCNTFVFKLFIIWKKEIVNFEDSATEVLNKKKRKEFEKESNFGELFDVVIHPADQSENDLHATKVLLSQPTRLTNNSFHHWWILYNDL